MKSIMKSILVTGHRGYIGSVLVKELLRSGYCVTGLDTGFYREASLGNEAFVPFSWNVDIRDFPADASMMSSFDAIVHLAALSNDPLGALDDSLTWEINGLDPGIFMKMAYRVIFASSCSVYGLAEKEVDETSELFPQTVYAKSKADSEAGFLRGGGTVLRFATAYGMSPVPRLDLVVNGLSLSEGEIRLQSDGTPWRPLVHVGDIARAIILAIEAPDRRVEGKVFNVGGENFQVRDIAGMVSKQLDIPVVVQDGAGPDNRSYKVNFNKIQTELGFIPHFTVRDGISEIIKYRSELTPRTRFIRLDTIKRLMDDKQIGRDLRWI